jgi:hypothetical protein
MAAVFQPLAPAIAKNVSAETNSETGGGSNTNTGGGGGGHKRRRRKGRSRT